MNLADLAPLLNPEPLKLETGYERLPDGSLHVAARTDMPACTGEMFDWWFRWFNTDQHYAWWHPVDHVSARWDARWSLGGPYIGATCVADEKLTGDEVYRLFIHFVDPSELLSQGALAAARENKHVSAVVAALVGFGDNPPIIDGRPRGGRLVHVARDTPTGVALRSHFFLGTDLVGQMSPAQIEETIPDSIGSGLLRHAYNEFTFLSRILPALFIAENRDRRRVELPW